ncbi:hypothetical protein AMTR_s00067p00069620 [Amborella trichopoda]|uniref:Bulb-type lectin domain-containing protein n=1 Tax=Amborella trichopoda TaxID=13333 RepID=U5D971_AMBTC|nr:hypothetical protein AMTR_s00067p00069620 [Amborella trichopoda]
MVCYGGTKQAIPTHRHFNCDHIFANGPLLSKRHHLFRPIPHRKPAITSKRNDFVMGYFTPGNSGNWYIGIWYGKVSVPTIVWVANRDKPLLSISAGDLRIGSDGNLVLLDELGRALWSTNAAGATSESLATLLDSGNLVLKQGNDSEKLRLNRRTRQNQFLTSWTSSKNPSPGHYSAGFNPQRPKELSIWEGNVEYWASGPRNDHFFSGVPEMRLYYIFNYSFVYDEVRLTSLTRPMITPPFQGRSGTSSRRSQDLNVMSTLSVEPMEYATTIRAHPSVAVYKALSQILPSYGTSEFGGLVA